MLLQSSFDETFIITDISQLYGRNDIIYGSYNNRAIEYKNRGKLHIDRFEGS